MTPTAKPAFTRAAETRDQRTKWLEAKAKALEEILRTPPKPERHLRPTGQMRKQGDDLAREEVKRQRVDILEELSRMKTASKPIKEIEPEKSRER